MLRPERPSYPPATLLRVGVALFMLLTLGLAPACAQLSTAYEEPDLSAPVFEINRLGLEPSVRAFLASILAAGVTYYNPTLDAKILGIALRLDPANRAALSAAACRRRGELPDASRHQGEAAYPPATVVGYLTGQSAGLRAKGGADNLALAGFLSNIAAELDPHDTAAQYERATCASLHAAPNWTFLKGRDAAPVETLPLLKHHSAIQGLGVHELPSGERAGRVMEMEVDTQEAHGASEAGVYILGEVGESMRAGLQEAYRAVKLRHPAFGAGQKLTVSFHESHGAKDGPSGDAAFTLMLFSLYDPLRLGSDCAITGDITVDGRVRAVGAVPSKIRAALADGCRVVAIPKENADALDDVQFLYPVNTLWQIQVVTVDTLDDALSVMREDRPADLKKALELFGEIQKRVGKDTPLLGAAHLELVPLLREVVRLAPGHASAAAMLRLLEGRRPLAMSVSASWDEVRRITQAALDAAVSREGGAAVDREAVDGGITRLEALRPQLDYRVAELCAAALDGLRAMRWVNTTNLSGPGYTEYRRSMDAIREVEGRMRGNASIMEAMR